MVRLNGPRGSSPESFPHARGDGPGTSQDQVTVAKFSPRPWGWSGRPRCQQRSDSVFPHARGDGPQPMAGECGCAKVFPTPVGMVRTGLNIRTGKGGFPHARGDGPQSKRLLALANLFSPRPWGWSAPRRFPRLRPEVFPTPVGMVRGIVLWEGILLGFPHARGDGPTTSQTRSASSWFSPRPWGWSAPAESPASAGIVFPTPVGMVRRSSSRRRSRACFPHARGDGPQ